MNLDIFNKEQIDDTKKSDFAPLAERMRPRQLPDFVGQESLVGPNSIIKRQVENRNIGSTIFWGPPGCGKTTLARIMAAESDADFHQISAVTGGVKDIKAVMELGEKNQKFFSKKTILFVDEIHRFNKAQQDYLLHSVEEGTIVLIGATTENPSFEVISPLLSRCRIYKMKNLSDQELRTILKRAMRDDEILKNLNPEIDKNDIDRLVLLAGGDARILLNAFESAVNYAKPDSQNRRKVTADDIEHVLQKKAFLYDKKGEYHYDIISAFIKSLRGSDPDAAAYWLMRMLEGGEEIKFIARRMVIFASEDIGNADPHALTLATSAFTSSHFVGLPEAAIILMQAVTYLASAPKSNAVVKSVKAAQKAVRDKHDGQVPMHIRNAPTKYMASEGYGKDYKYPHSFEGNFVRESYLPEGLDGMVFYEPTENGKEKEIKERLENLWKDRYKESRQDNQSGS